MKRANGHGEQKHASQVLRSGFQNSTVQVLGVASIATLCQESWRPRSGFVVVVRTTRSSGSHSLPQTRWANCTRDSFKIPIVGSELGSSTATVGRPTAVRKSQRRRGRSERSFQARSNPPRRSRAGLMVPRQSSACEGLCAQAAALRENRNRGR